MTDTRRTGIQIRKQAGRGTIAIEIPPGEYVPKRVLYVDYADVQRSVDGVRLKFGKFDPFAETEQDAKLHYALEVSFPNAQFCNQLYRSIRQPSEPGKPLFTASLEAAITSNGYSRIEKLPVPRGADKQAFIRANAAVMFVFEDDTSVDFLHLDAMSLHLASKGKPVGDVGDVLRVVMAPNLLLYFLERVKTIAQEMLSATPELEKEVPDDDA